MKLLFDAKMGRLHGKVIRVIIEFAALVVHRAPYGECLPSTEGSLAHALQRMIFTKHSRDAARRRSHPVLFSSSCSAPTCRLHIVASELSRLDFISLAAA